VNVGEIVREIKRAGNEQRIVLIAIEGFGGSGKTTFAEKLKKALGNTYIIHIDDFVIKEKINDFSPDKTDFDRARLKQQVLAPASQNLSVVYQQLKWAENKLSAPIRIPKSDFLIVEGISSYHPDIAKYYDYKIWVNVPIELATRRGKLKDAGNENEKYWDLWARSDLAYQRKYHPEQRADFIYSITN